jgi:UDP-N-acetylglucosamine 3-dehydrogenase
MKAKTKNFRIAVIGAGIHAETNIFPSLANHLLADVDKAAVCDLDQGKARRMASMCGCGNTYTDYRQMIETEHPDGTIVCLNASLHPKVVVDCLENGVPVLVEKAPAATVEQARAMLDASKRTGKIVMIAHQKRHGTAYRKAKEIVSNVREFGRIVQIEAKMHGMPRFPNNFCCLMEWQIHNIDLIRWFGGDISSIKIQSQVYGENTAALVMALKFANEAVGALSWGTYGGPGPYCERLEIISDQGKGVIVENAYNVTYYNESWGNQWRPDWNPNLGNQSQVLMGYVGEIQRFVECVRNGAAPSSSIEDGVKNLEAIFEIARQMQISTEWIFTPSRF